MMDVNKVLVACDFSSYMRETLEYAVGIAGKMGADVVIANIINKRDVDTILKVGQGNYDPRLEQYIVQNAETYVRQKTKEREKKLDELIKSLGCDNIAVKKIIETGVPLQQLLRVIHKEKPDLVIMGPKGRGDLKEMLYGSVAEKMFRRCPVPLLSVRMGEN